jgi:HPt (histidine-containing phosphotransfer) domain-containing protein
METNAASESPKVTNLEYLVKLSKGNEQFVKEMVRIFLAENPAEINTLEKAIEEKDFSLINSAAHKLRSTVPFVGIDKIIAEEISEIEQLALNKSGNFLYEEQKVRIGRIPTDKELIQKIQSLFSKIKRICRRAYDELQVYTQ